MSAIVSTLTLVLETLLVFRALLKLFGAFGSSLIDFVYQLSDPLVAPFGRFVPNIHYGSYLVEWSTIVALFAYGAIGFLLMELVRSLTIRTRG